MCSLNVAEYTIMSSKKKSMNLPLIEMNMLFKSFENKNGKLRSPKHAVWQLKSLIMVDIVHNSCERFESGTCRKAFERSNSEKYLHCLLAISANK